MSGGDSTATLAKQAGITFVGNVIGKSLKFGFVIAATWLVSPGKYGLYVLAFSIVSLLQSVSNLGMNQAVDYYVPNLLRRNKEREARTYVATITLFTFFGSSTIAIGLVIAAPWLENAFGQPGLGSALVVFAIAVPLLALQSVANTFFISIKRMDFHQLTINITRPVIKVSAAGTLVLVGLGVTGLVVGHVLAIAAALTFSVGLAVYNTDWLRPKNFSSMPIREVVSYSLPLAFAGIIFGVVGQIDFFVLGYYRDASSVGIYRVAYLLATSIVIFHASLTPIFKPLIVEACHDSEALTAHYRTATRWVTIVTLPVATTFLILPGTYLSLIFSPPYAAATTAFSILIVGQLINVGVGPTGRILEAMGRTKLVFLNTLILVFVNVSLDLLLVPEFGLLGAAVGTAVALILIGSAALLEVWYYWGPHPVHFELGKVYFAAIPASLCALSVTSLASPTVSAWVIPIVITSIYFLVLRAVGVFTEDDVAIARRIDSRIGRQIVEPLIS